MTEPKITLEEMEEEYKKKIENFTSVVDHWRFFNEQIFDKGYLVLMNYRCEFDLYYIKNDESVLILDEVEELDIKNYIREHNLHC